MNNAAPREHELQAALQHPGWGVAGSLAAPATIAVGSTLYVSGFTYRETLLRLIGLSDGVVSVSIQATMAKGYEALLVFLMLFTALVIIVASFTVAIIFILKLLGKIAQRFSAFGFIRSLFEKSKPKQRKFPVINLIILALTIGFVSGVSSALIDFIDINHRAHLGCFDKCHEYIFKNSKKIRGIMIVQDDKTVVIFGPEGTSIWPAIDLQSTHKTGKQYQIYLGWGLLHG